MTFIATANAVSMTGAKVVIADIDPNTLNLCADSASKLINSRTKAIIPVHVSGRAANLPALKELCDSHGLVLIEDAAEAFLSKNFGAALGTHGNTGIFSFSPMKTITTGQGGAIMTNDSDVHSRLRELKDQGRPVRGTGGADTHVSVGFNFKLTNIQAAMGLAQLNRVDARLQRMRRTYEIYRTELSGIEGFNLVGFDLEAGEVPQWIDAVSPRREQLIDQLKVNKMDCRRFWHPVHRQAPYRQNDSEFPKASKAADQAFWLPSAFTVTDEDILKVCQVILKFFKKSPRHHD
ncbi:MAG: DegT/DnrJ/EryC1/StrS family aminotransferase [Planctomycetota bacterium]|nr:DegT/DnrJ/EryC1/StrS family aminotransferase [Planctomycetota bacterium]